MLSEFWSDFPHFFYIFLPKMVWQIYKNILELNRRASDEIDESEKQEKRVSVLAQVAE